mmetsp:Transcript_28920/g.62296  ORF Transcript_28920/g.62296 Transcript_28920/m.62296 type:complete len:224 (-) Transcript_28920:66-737(-)
MPKGQLDHLSNLRHLAPAAANVVIPNVVRCLLVLALHRLPLAVDLRVGRAHAVGRGVHLHHLELHRMHRSAHKEEVALAQGAVCLQEVGLEVDLEQVAGHALDGVVQGQDVHLLAVGHVFLGCDGDSVSQPDAQVLSDDLVHADVDVLGLVVGQHDADGVPALLALQQHSVTAEKLQLLHLRGAQADHRVVVVGCIVHDQAIGSLFLVHNGCVDLGLRVRHCL